MKIHRDINFQSRTFSDSFFLKCQPLCHSAMFLDLEAVLDFLLTELQYSEELLVLSCHFNRSVFLALMSNGVERKST